MCQELNQLLGERFDLSDSPFMKAQRASDISDTCDVDQGPNSRLYACSDPNSDKGPPAWLGLDFRNEVSVDDRRQSW